MVKNNFTLGKEWNCEGKMVELLHNGEIIGYVFKNNLNELADPTKVCNHLNKICTENQQNGRNIRY
jgi:hypothetical protein